MEKIDFSTVKHIIKPDTKEQIVWLCRIFSALPNAYNPGSEHGENNPSHIQGSPEKKQTEREGKGISEHIAMSDFLQYGDA